MTRDNIKKQYVWLEKTYEPAETWVTINNLNLGWNNVLWIQDFKDKIQITWVVMLKEN